MKRRIAVLILSLAVGMSLCVVAFAANTEAAYDEQLQKENAIAYLDLDDASPEMQEKILEARREIIFNTEWVADGHFGYIQNMETGEIVREVPEFSEVFPGWDAPIIEEVVPAENPDVPDIIEDNSPDIVPLSADDWIRLFSDRYYLNSASSTENADPFVTLTIDPYDDGTSVRAEATSLSSSETCNVGISDYYTGESYGVGMRLTEGEAYVAYVGTDSPTVSVRASTSSTPGWATMVVDSGYRLVDVK